MGLFHVHQWRDEAWTFTPPLKRSARRFKVWGDEYTQMAERMMMGFTTVTQRCTSCGKVATRAYEGRVSPGGGAVGADGQLLVLIEAPETGDLGVFA